MKISDFLHKDAVCTDLKSETKVDVITEMVAMLVDNGIIEKKHKNKIITDLHRMPNEILQKVRGCRGKSLSTLKRRLHSLAASCSLFSSFRHQPLPAHSIDPPPLLLPALKHGPMAHAHM